MAKSATFGVIHLGIAFGISFALTGSVTIAGAITLLEPLANTVAHYFFDRWWARREARAGGRARRSSPRSGGAGPGLPPQPRLAGAGERATP